MLSFSVLINKKNWKTLWAIPGVSGIRLWNTLGNTWSFRYQVIKHSGQYLAFQVLGYETLWAIPGVSGIRLWNTLGVSGIRLRNTLGNTWGFRYQVTKHSGQYLEFQVSGYETLWAIPGVSGIGLRNTLGNTWSFRYQVTKHSGLYLEFQVSVTKNSGQYLEFQVSCYTLITSF